MKIIEERRVSVIRGLGDAVAIVAEPIAAVSDRVLKTHLVGCGGCKRRRQTLNRLVPFGPKQPAANQSKTVDAKEN